MAFDFSTVAEPLPTPAPPEPKPQPKFDFSTIAEAPNKSAVARQRLKEAVAEPEVGIFDSRNPGWSEMTEGISEDLSLNPFKNFVTGAKVLGRAASSAVQGVTGLGETIGNALKPDSEQLAREAVTGRRDADIAMNFAKTGQQLPPNSPEQVAQIRSVQGIVDAERAAQDPYAITNAIAQRTDEVLPPLKSPILQSGAGAAEAMAPYIINPALGAAVQAGHRGKQASEAGATPGHALGVSAASAALDTVGLGAGKLLAGSTKSVPLLAAGGGAMGTGYQLANSGITETYNPEQAAEERDLPHMALAVGMGLTPAAMHSIGRYSDGAAAKKLGAQHDQMVADQAVINQNIREQTLADLAESTRMNTPAARAAEELMQRTSPAEASQAVNRFDNPVADVPMVAGGTKPVAQPLVSPELSGRSKPPVTRPVEPTEQPNAYGFTKPSGKSQPPATRPVEPTEQPDLYTNVVRPSGKSQPPVTGPIEPTEAPNAYGFTKPSGKSAPPATVIPHEEAAGSSLYGIGKPSGVSKPPPTSTTRTVDFTPRAEEAPPGYARESLDLPESALKVIDDAKLTPDEHTSLQEKLKGWDAHFDPNGAAANVQDVINKLVRPTKNASRKGAIINPIDEVIAAGKKKVGSILRLGRNKDALREYEQLQRNLSASKFKVTEIDNIMSKATKQFGGRFNDEINKFLEGDTSVSIPQPLREALLRVRNLHDSVSTDLVGQLRAVRDRLDDTANQLDAGGQSDEAQLARTNAEFFGSRADVVEGNLGEYIGRPYAIHTKGQAFVDHIRKKPEYEAAIQDVMQTQGLNREQATNEIERILSKNNPDAQTGMGQGSMGAKTGVLQERQDLSEPIRKLLGEVTDPVQRTSISVANALQTLENYRFQNRLAQLGEKGGFYDQPRPGFETRLAGEGSLSFGPLAGKYTSQANAKWLTASQSQGTMWKIIRELNALSKAAVTTLNVPVGMLRNFGSISTAAFNGHLLDPVAWPHAIETGLKIIADKGTREKLTRLGVIHQGFGGAEMRQLLTELKGRGEVSSDSYFDVAKKYYRKTMSGAATLYSTPDDILRVVGYEAELNNARRIGLSGDAAEKFAADRVSNQYQTWSRLPEAQKAMRYVPFVGNFAGFISETARITPKIGMAMVDDFKRGNVVGGMMKLGGMVGTATVLANAMGALTDATPEQEKVLRSYLPTYLRNSYGFWKKVDEENWKFYNCDWVNPWSYFNGIKKGIENEEYDTTVRQAIDPWLGESRFTQAAVEAMSGKDQRDRPLYLPNASNAEKAGKGAAHFITQVAVPPTAWKAKQVIAGERDATDLVNPFSRTTVNVPASMGRETQKGYQQQKAEKAELYREANTKGEMTPEIAQQVSDAEGRQKQNERTQLEKAQTLGLSENKAMAALSNANVRPKDIGQASGEGDLTGDPPEIIQARAELERWKDKNRAAIVAAETFRAMPQGLEKAQFLKAHSKDVTKGMPDAMRTMKAQALIQRAATMPASSRAEILAQARALYAQTEE